jgi:UPF0716 protein FxsA
MVALVIFACWLAAELLVAVAVAHAIGVIATIVLMIAGWPIGVWVLRSHGRAAWRRLIAAVSAGRTPTREVVDGALILVGGVLLIIPGLVTDAIAACLLLPPTRALVRPLLVRNLHSRVVTRAAQRAGGRSSYDVDSTATDVDQPQLHS